MAGSLRFWQLGRIYNTVDALPSRLSGEVRIFLRMVCDSVQQTLTMTRLHFLSESTSCQHDGSRERMGLRTGILMRVCPLHSEQTRLWQRALSRTVFLGLTRLVRIPSGYFGALFWLPQTHALPHLAYPYPILRLKFYGQEHGRST